MEGYGERENTEKFMEKENDEIKWRELYESQTTIQ